VVANHPGEEPPVELTFLRTLEDATPAVGSFEGWPKRLADLKMLDPCMGSGHFLVTFFHMLVPMRMREEGLTAKEACDAVLRDNIHGLEIDRRCTEIAAFALALAAWTYPAAGGYRSLPEMNLACCGLPVSASKEEWMAFAKSNSRLQDGMSILYKLFNDAPILGSLINPRRFVQGDIVTAGYDELKPLMEKALESENSGDNAERKEIGVAARGLSKAAALLGETYHLVATNVPYLARGRQAERLKSFCESYYTKAKNDLATVFLERCLEFCEPGGSVCMVLPQLWLNLIGFKKMRQSLVRSKTIDFIVNLGVGAFDAISGEVVNTILFQTTTKKPQEKHTFPAIDTKDVGKGSNLKAAALIELNIKIFLQDDISKNPDCMILLDDVIFDSCFNKYVLTTQGIGRGDLERFDRYFCELSSVNREKWSFLISSPVKQGQYEGREKVFLWEQGSGELVRCPSARIQGMSSWGVEGVALSRSQDLRVTLTNGFPHAENCVAIAPSSNSGAAVRDIWCFCKSDVFKDNVRKLNTKVIIPTGVVSSVNFELLSWKEISQQKYPYGLPKPYSDDPTQWIFHGHPCGSVVWDDEEKSGQPQGRFVLILQCFRSL
jgi:hypothetical protein